MPEQQASVLEPVQIEIWSDVVCPWCYIGKRRLEQALAAEPGPVHITHRAFQLDPGASSEGRRTVEVLAQKFRTGPQQVAQMMSQVTEVASSVGLEYRLDHTLSGNTAPAHRLLLWAQDLGKGQELLEALYAGYFTDALPIFTADDLMPFVEQVGLDTDAARSLLAADDYLDRVISDQQVAAELGATGVPFFVLDARLGISGAQPAEVFSQALARARQARTEEG